MSLTRLTELLDSHKIRYTVISHSVAYTAQAIAALTHIPGKELVKTVVVNIDGNLAMAAVPASSQVDLMLLKQATGAHQVQLASENEFRDKFPDCELGAMPPFGNLYGMKVFVDESLSRDTEIAFNAGCHRELVRMLWDDFNRLVQPRLLKIAGGRASASAA